MHPNRRYLVVGLAAALLAGCEPSKTPEPPAEATPAAAENEPTTQERPEAEEPEPDSQPTADANAEPAGQPTPDQPAPVSSATQIVTNDGQVIPVSTGAAPGYVPDASCRECHALICDSYQHVGMARSAYRPTVDNIIEDYDHGTYYHEPSQRYYEMSHRDGVFYQKRYQLDANGKHINEYEARVDFIIGSGKNVRTYVTRDPGGEFYQLPVSWYSKTHEWAMSPGYDKANNPGFTRMLKRECMFCHNAYPQQPEGTDVLGQPLAYPRTLPEGIGCQRCHGPGAEHTRVALNPESGPTQLRSSIVNPAHLEPQLRDDVCNQCHLQPSANPSSFLRLTGRSDYSYKPGERLRDYELVVDYGSAKTKAERFEINHAPYRLYQSPCYIKSNGAMSCLTCHDPHSKPEPDERVAYYRSKCLTCHKIEQCDAAMAQKDSAHADRGVDCIHCHMPKHRPEDVIHVVATDHWIRRDPAPEEWTAPLKELGKRHLGKPMPYSPDYAPQEKDKLVLNLAMFAARRGATYQLAAVENVIGKAKPTGADPYLYLAELELTAGKMDFAENSYRTITKQFPNLLAGYTGLAFALSRQGKYEDALTAAQEAVQLNPNSADAYQQLGTALLKLGRVNEAGPSFERAVQLRPMHIEARSNLARARAAAGDLQGAVAEYNRILAIDPLDIQTYSDLTELLVFLKQAKDAIARLEHGLRLEPNARTIQASLAAALVTDNQFDAALEAAAKARALGANEALVSAVEAIAYHQTGRGQKAIRAFQRMEAAGIGQIKSNVLYAQLRDRTVALLIKRNAKP